MRCDERIVTLGKKGSSSNFGIMFRSAWGSRFDRALAKIFRGSFRSVWGKLSGQKVLQYDLQHI